MLITIAAVSAIDPKGRFMARSRKRLKLERLVRSRMKQLLRRHQTRREALRMMMIEEVFQRLAIGVEAVGPEIPPIRSRASFSRSSTNGSVTLVADVSLSKASAAVFDCSNAL